MDSLLSDFNRRLTNLTHDHSQYRERIDQALLRVEHHREAGVANNAPAGPGEEGR